MLVWGLSEAIPSGELNWPAPGAAIYGHHDFSTRGRVVNGIVKNNEIGTKLSDGKRSAIDAQLDSNVG